MKLSTIIVNWNTSAELEQCLLSLEGRFSSAPGEAEIIVVDNASSDDSVAMVRRRFAQVRLLENSQNEGFARANNSGIRVSSGEFLLLLNPDTEVRAGAVETLIDFLETHPDAAMAGPRLLNSDGSLQESCYPAPTLPREMWRLFHGDRISPRAIYDMSSWRQDTPRAVDVLKGACLLVRRDVMLECGLLDEGFFIYSEDQDLCKTLRRCGWKIYWVPSASIVHHGAKSSIQAEMAMFLQLYKAKIRYFRKHHGVLSASAYKLVLLCAALARQVAGLVSAPRSANLLIARKYRFLIKMLPTL
jgi:GT2 family glycosyltransferase